jgi:hypothetical protein
LAGTLLGWEPEVKLADGLARAIEWIEANAAAFATDRYVI